MPTDHRRTEHEHDSTALQAKDALDEARMLVLGAQVLLSFQYSALFQSGFAGLPLAARRLDAAAMGLMLTALILLLATVPYYLVAARRDESDSVLSYTRQRVVQALLPFALAIGLDVGMVAQLAVGSIAATASGMTATALALLFWYGTRWLRPANAGPPAKMIRSTALMIPADPPPEPTPLSRKIDHMLVEGRVVLPGIQALLGFQFTAMLSDAFHRMDRTLQMLHLAGLGLMALAMVMVMAVPAYHRLVADGKDRPDVERFGTAMVLAALAPIALGLACDFYILLRQVEFSPPLSLGLALLTLGICAALWVLYPLLARRAAEPARHPRA